MESKIETPGLLESFRGAFARKKDQDASDTKATWAEYRQLLTRANSPRKGDAERLVTLVEKLDLSERDVEAHVHALDEFLRVKNVAAGAIAAEAELKKLRAAQEVSGRRFVEARQAHASDCEAVEESDRRLQGIKRSSQDMENMRQRQPDLLGDA